MLPRLTGAPVTLRPPASLLGPNVGFLTPKQERLQARPIVLASDLEIALLDT